MTKLVATVCYRCLHREVVNLQTFGIWNVEAKKQFEKTGELKDAYPCDRCKKGKITLLAVNG